MKYEQQLASRYHEAHNRLWGPPPEIKTFPPRVAKIHENPESLQSSTDYPQVNSPIINELPEISGAPTFEQLLSWVAMRESYPEILLLSKSQRHGLVHARQILYYLCRRYVASSWARIGRWLHRDHATIMSGYKRVKARMERDPDFAEHMLGYTQHIEQEMQRFAVCPYCGK